MVSSMIRDSVHAGPRDSDERALEIV